MAPPQARSRPFRAAAFLALLALAATVALAKPTWYPNDAVDGVGHLLRHVDHPDSPLKQSYTSEAERITTYVGRDRARWSLLLQRYRASNASAGSSYAAAATNNFKQPASETGIAQYYVSLPFGTPAQKKVLLFDTGSNLIWIQGLCKSCSAQPYAYYNPKASSTYRAVLCSSSLCRDIEPTSRAASRPCAATSKAQCPYTYQYVSGGTQGVLATETVTLPRTRGAAARIPGILFGIGQYNQGFGTAVDGLLGAGRSAISLPTQLRPYYRNSFSVCFTPYNSGKASQVVYGAASIPTRGTAWTPLLTNAADPEDTFYYVQVTKVTVAGRGVAIPASAWALDRVHGMGATIFDTGSNFAQLAAAAFFPIFDAVVSHTRLPLVSVPRDSGLDGPCFQAAAATLDKDLPAITFYFQNRAYWTLYPKEYMIQYNANVFCNNVLLAPLEEPQNVVGALLMADTLLVFDVAGARAGFHRVTCATGGAFKP